MDGIIRILIGCFLLILPLGSWSQDFGRNKPHYKDLEFKVFQTPHFEVYHYLNNDSLINGLSRESEIWYNRHLEIFRDTFPTHNPIIFYNNHSDFSQTRIIQGLVGVGTGGVTEALRNRVVMPLTESPGQTSHVLGHELVHAFQYNMLRNPSGENMLSLSNIRNLPLWMVEGLAEYMSIGNIDPHTAMWMRDAVREDDIPTLKDLSRSNKYFPYRYGQAVWSYIAGIYGDTVIYPLFRETARVGYKKAVKNVLGADEKVLSNAWENILREYYGNMRSSLEDDMPGSILVDRNNGGHVNIAPSLSPNGQFITFWSEKNIFTIELFLADAKTGKILKKLSSKVRSGDVDNFSFLESTGAWSPNSNRFAFVIFSDGINKLAITDIGGGKAEEIKIEGVPALSNPSWSPDGQYIAFTGLKNGHSDLYIYDLRNKKVSQITNDGYADIHPSWSHEGRYILFTSDRPVDGGALYDPNALNISMYDLEEGKIKTLDVFNGAKNLNPLLSPDGQSIYFVSDRDGFRNLYRYEIAEDQVYQLTSFWTGISGITSFSPAISLSPVTKEVVYTYYQDRKYILYRAATDQFHEQPVNKYALNYDAAVLPPSRRTLDIVNSNLRYDEYVAMNTDTIKEKNYTPKLQLEYIGNTAGAGINNSTLGGNSRFNGGVNMMFGDMLGYHKLFSSLNLNGEIYDFGGQFAYLNKKNQLNWGVAASHTPYQRWFPGITLDTLNVDEDTIQATNYYVDILRTFADNGSVFAYLPFSQTRRLEFNGGYTRIYYRRDRINNYYYQNLRIGQGYDQNLEAPEGFDLANLGSAYVFDNSYFGMASPSMGQRYRLEANRNFGFIDYYSLRADYRKYWFVKPYTLAVRLMHLARFGQDAESNKTYPLSFAYPFLTRGNQFSNVGTQEGADQSLYNVNQMFGSRIFVANAEWRIPFSGPERLAFIKSGILFTELTVFADAGIAWNSLEGPTFNLEPSEPTQRVPYMSTGISGRINVFGQIVIEPYLAFPWRGDHFTEPVFGFNFVPGW